MNDLKTRDDLEKILRDFYGHVLQDNLLQPVFAAQEDFSLETHLPQILDFWETLILKSGSHTGNVFESHKRIHEKTPLTKDHFDRWLQYFNDAVDRHAAGEKATDMKTRAAVIATTFHSKLNK